MEKVIRDSLDDYYGLLINDSLIVTASTKLLENKSCAGRITNDIKNFTEHFVELKTRKDDFNKYHLKYLVSGLDVNLNENSKAKIILIISYQVGRLRRSDFKMFQKYVANHSDRLDVFYVCIDPCYTLK